MKELNLRVVLLGIGLCALASAATPYVTLKLGMSVDLTMGGMFLTAFLFSNRYSNKELAIQLNIIQSMIAACSGIAFMVVILAAFYYIKVVFNRDIGFNPSFMQMFIWLLVSANLGIFMGIVPRKAILKDRTIPWPTSRANLSVAQTLSDPSEGENTGLKRNVLSISTAVAGFLTFLRDSFGVIPSIVGNATLNMSMGLELAAIGLGMLVPLSVGLSGLLGTWFINMFGTKVAKLSALSGTPSTIFDTCMANIDKYSTLTGQEQSTTLEFLVNNCGKAADFVQSTSHFKYVVQWMMWPATAMMIAAAITSVIIPVVKNWVEKRNADYLEPEHISLADEEIPWSWIIGGIASSVIILVWITCSWFDMPWAQVLLAIAIQPILVIAGLRVLGITGSGPVSLMANATQFLFGILWPAQIKSNLTAAYISANPQASSENVVPSFWVAQRIGGKFTTLIIAQLIVVPVGAFLTPLMFQILQKTYGVGLGAGQLSAPTGLKIATLAIVMEKGLSYLPQGALQASVIAIFIGIVFELLLAIKKTDASGNKVSKFWWIPIPSAFGFALILPPSLNIGIAIGSIISTVWGKFSPKEKGSFNLLNAPLASGLIAGEAIVGSILLPLISVLMEFFS